MTRLLVVLLLILSPAVARAEKTTFDLLRFTPPAPWKKAGWKKELTKTNLGYTSVDKSTGTYCQIFIVKSTTSKGDLASDFDSEWKDVIVGSFKVTDAPTMTDPAEADGWQVKAGVATFPFDGGTSIALLTTGSGFGRVVSIVAVTNNADYVPVVQAFLGSVELIKPPATTAKTAAKSPAKEAAKPAALQGYMEYSPFTKTWTWKLRYPPK